MFRYIGALVPASPGRMMVLRPRRLRRAALGCSIRAMDFETRGHLNALRYRCMRNSARLALPNTAIRVLSVYLDRLDLVEFARSMRMIGWPTIAAIKSATGCSHSSVIYARQDLVAAGMATKLRGSVHDQVGVYEFHGEPLQAVRRGAELNLPLPAALRDEAVPDDIAEGNRQRMAHAREALAEQRNMRRGRGDQGEAVTLVISAWPADTPLPPGARHA